MRIHGTSADLLARRPLAVEGCASGAALALGEGTHQLRTAPGLATGLDLDRLVLHAAASGAGGSPAAPAAPTAPTGPAGPPDPSVTVTGQSRTSVEGTVTPGAGPFWLILGQGLNEGWHASLAGRDLGPPQPVDGGMNGWLVTDPGSGSGPVRFSMTWTPQRWVTGGLVVAGASVLLCLVLLVLPTLRGRRRHARRSPPAAGPPATPPPSPSGAYGAESVPIRRRHGLGGRVRRGEGGGPPRPWLASLLAALAVGLVTALVMPPWYALLTAPVTLLAARVPALRRVTAIGAITSFGLVAAFYVARQVVSAPAPGFGWPSAFERAHDLALLGVVLVAADALVAAIRPRQAVHYPAPEPTSPEPR